MAAFDAFSPLDYLKLYPGLMQGILADPASQGAPPPAQAIPSGALPNVPESIGPTNPVKTTRINRTPPGRGAFGSDVMAQSGGVLPPEAPPGGPSPSTAALMDLYRGQAGAGAPEESQRERLGRMMMNFGTGMSSGASNISGRRVGPDIFEGLAGGAASLGKGEQAAGKTRKAEKAAATKQSQGALENMMKLAQSGEKEDRERAKTAFDQWLKKQQLKVNARKGGGLGDYLIGRIAPRLIAQGTTPEELVPQLNTVLSQIKSDPELARQLGLDQDFDF